MSTSAPYHILCVDDASTDLKLWQMILQVKGYLVSTASTASEALAVFKSEDFDIVVTDQLLPGAETGTAMAKEMKHLIPQVPIIVLSGTVDTPDGIEVVDAFIRKVDGIESLLAKVEGLADRSRTARVSSVAGSSEEEGAFSTQSETLQLLAAVVESSEEAILSKTLDGTILTWNKAAERMYGYRAEEIIGQSVTILQPSDRRGEVHDIFEGLKKDQKVEHVETMRVAKDGHLLTVSLTISPIRDAGGRIIGASAIAHDITGSKLAEQALRNSEKLAVAGRMAATVAHEINNPLETVTNALYLVAESPSLDESARKFLAIAQDELAKITQIATATLGLHRGNAAHRQPVRVSELIDNVLSLYARRLRSLGVSVETRYETDVFVNAFPGELRQVFSNLVVNAIDVLENSDDKLYIHVFRSFDWTNPTQRGIRITVSDTGPGIPADKRGRIFEPFFTTKEDKGTGIGLWVCLGIVQKYGGKIRFRSTLKPGHSGTTFSVFLPTETGQAGITSIAA
jgi:PAS domain S-box-containing protein